jgi:hypothetical protein
MAANPPSLSEIAALAGSPAHANMLTAPLDGRAASELAYAGGVAPQTRASISPNSKRVASWLWQSKAGILITGSPPR